MLFNSFDFLLFFIIVTLLYFSLPHKARWLLLLLSSCYFYMAFVPIYILILGFTIVIDYFAGIYIENANGKRRKLFLIFSLIANIGVLSVFKYYNFINQNFSFLLHGFGLSNPFPYLKILLPIGLSFHTFQAMSYTIEVYRGNQKPEKHFGIYALYVMFFPQLVAGPIERPQNMLHQFHERKYFNYDNLYAGLKLILWGLFKKAVVADRIAMLVDEVYNHPYQYHGFAFLIATAFFSTQIYCDFSGYSDIALGTARILGFKLMTNFKQPYFSKSISEFWTRWHISLSSWFKDYLYIPMGGNRVSIPRWYFNLLFVFIISGLWHGANWTFIIWGCLHGILLVIQNLKFRFLNKLKIPVPFQILSTFILVSLLWVFFRASSLSDALYIIKNLFSPNENGKYFSLVKINIHGLPDTYFGIALWKFNLSLLLILVLYTADWLLFTGNAKEIMDKYGWLAWTIYYLLIISILFFGVFETRQFIYFQF
jgi:alginate O-acetyltransferase complex protein AlgI